MKSHDLAKKTPGVRAAPKQLILAGPLRAGQDKYIAG
jgi:hypothetical protein